MKNPITVEYADGSTVASVRVNCYIDIGIDVGGTLVVLSALITKIKRHRVFLGYDWLEAVNPTIDWAKKTVSFKTSPANLVVGRMEVEEGTPNYKVEFPAIFTEKGSS
jgi:hypothetical protein